MRLTRFLMTALLLAMAGRSNAQSVNGPRQYIIVIDLSASRTPEILAEDTQFVTKVIDGLNYGDAIRVMQMQQEGLNDRPRHWESAIPLPKDSSFTTRRDQDQLAGHIKSLKYVAPEFFRTKDLAKVMHTDIFTTLQVANEFADDRGGRRTVLILLSDMLQSAKGFEMERLARMPSPNWIKEQQKLGLLPSFHGACVAVIGADATTRAGVTVRNFWQQYFLATGTTLDQRHYRITPPPVEDLCR